LGGEVGLIIFLIALVWPTVLCMGFARIYRRDGAGALWRWAAGSVLALAVFGFLKPSLTYYQTDPLVGAGVMTISFPIAAVVAAVFIHAVARLGAPGWSAVVLGSIAATAVANALLWIS
jgi:hypothetical protein